MGEQDEVATLHVATLHAAIDETADLQAHFWRALARPSLADASEAALAADTDAGELARDRLGRGDVEGALRVLESARGLALYAATEVRPATDHLAEAGKLDLARQWQSAAAVADPHHLPAELRRNVLGTLLTRSPAAGLLGPPAVAEIQSALIATDADALVHLIPGHAIVVPATGRATHLALPALTPASDHIERFLATLALHNAIAAAPGRPPAGLPDIDLTASLQELCRWAWDAVVGPLLEHLLATRFPGAAPLPLQALGAGPDRRHVPRVVLVAAGDLARVPWAAARRDDGAYAVQLMAISQAVSARMLCHNATLPPMPPASAGLIVSDPDTDGQARELPSARLEAYAINQALLPQSRLTGRRPDGTASPSGAGTLDQLRAWLTTSNPAAGTLLHLACTGFARPGADAYALMAGGERLTVTEVLVLRGRAQRRPLDLVVLAGGRTGLSVTGYDEAFGLGTAFLAGGVRSVLATRWTVPDAAAPALLFMTHLLRQSGRPTWAALRDAQLWMLDPGRDRPTSMPADLLGAVARTDPAKPIAWAAVTHWGH